jgi:alpha-methylacyl-CoA racemase
MGSVGPLRRHGGPLGAVGADEPVPALNLIGDFAGGSLPAVLGTVMALLARERTGRGQIVDAGMVDGAAYLMFAQFAEMARGLWHGRGTSTLSGGAPFYTVYRCADGGWMSVGSIESKFYAQLLKVLDLDDGFLKRQHERTHWAADRAAIAAVFATQPRDYWAALFAGSDACAYPVLDLDEVARDPHVTQRGSVVVGADGQPAVSPAPKLSDTPGSAGAPPQLARAAQLAILAERGVSTEDIERYCESGALHLAD